MKIIFLLLFSVNLYGCSKQTIENEIVDYIKTNCKQFPCILSMRDVTKFDWDKMYIFDIGASVGEVEKVVGIYIPEETRNTRKLIFTKDDKVVSYNELPTNVESIINNQILFDNYGNYSHKVYLVKESVFEAYKDSSNSKDVYYTLKQVKNNL